MSEKARWTVRYDALSDRMIYRRRLGPFQEKCSYRPIYDEDIPLVVVAFCADHGVDVCAYAPQNQQVSNAEAP